MAMIEEEKKDLQKRNGLECKKLNEKISSIEKKLRLRETQIDTIEEEKKLLTMTNEDLK